MMQASVTSRCYSSSFNHRPVKPYFGTDKSAKNNEDETPSSSSKSRLTKPEHAESSGQSKRKDSTSTDSLQKSSDALPSTTEQHQAVSEADHALKATSRWLNQFDQPAGKLPKLPAAPPSATLTNTESLQKAISRGDLSGFSNSFEHTLSQINSAQGQNVNLYLRQRMQELKLRQRLELELVLRSSLDQGANRYALYTETLRQFKNTRTNPLNKADIRLAFKYIGAPIHPLGLLVWRVRQFFRRFSRVSSSPVTQHPASSH